MPGQAHTLRRRPVLLAAISLLLLLSAVGGAGASRSHGALRGQVAALSAKSRAAVLSLYSLDQQFANAQARLAALRGERRQLQSEGARVARELTVAQRGTRIAQQHLGVRLRALYEQGNVEPLEILFGATSLDEALNSLDSLTRSTGQDKAVLREVKTARAHLATALRDLAAKAAALHTATEQAASTSASLLQAHAARSAYIRSLATRKRMTERRLTALIAQAHAAAIRSARLARRRAATPIAEPVSIVPVPAPPAVGPNVAGHRLTVTATGYSMGGTTATGLPVGWGVAAVDPSVIPLGSRLTVPGYGEAVAADVGSSIVGATIDLWFPTTAQANAWGRRVVTIVVH